MNLFNLIGFIAAISTTISFVPQAIQTIKTKDTKGISLPMYILFTTGVFLWLVYGVYFKMMPVIIANSITLILASTILSFKIRYK